MKRHIWGCLALMMLAACSGSNTENKEKEGVETVLPQQVNEVTVMKLAKGNFNHELVSNGKIGSYFINNIRIFGLRFLSSFFYIGIVILE